MILVIKPTDRIFLQFRYVVNIGRTQIKIKKHPTFAKRDGLKSKTHLVRKSLHKNCKIQVI
jgi:hypothetical protein